MVNFYINNDAFIQDYAFCTNANNEEKELVKKEGFSFMSRSRGEDNEVCEVWVRDKKGE